MPPAPVFAGRESVLEQEWLDDGTADRFLLDAAGATLVVFVAPDCGNCRLARERLPGMNLPVRRLAWIDAADNRGLVERYEVFHLPSLYLVRDGVFYGAVNAKLEAADIGRQVALALQSYPAELP